MTLEITRRFLDGALLGLFGAGHLGRTFASSLLDSGLPRGAIAICHRGSLETTEALTSAGLNDLVKDSADVVSNSRILFYLVRPQNYQAIAGCIPPRDCLFISFLAGVPLYKIPIENYVQRIRAMLSAPDTLRQRVGIAALYPSNSPVVRDILESLGLKIVALNQESDIHAFTALGPCLPIALAYWESLGHKTDRNEILELGSSVGLLDFQPILEWAQEIQPRNQDKEQLSLYLAQAATPGGVTEAIISEIQRNMSLIDGLQMGIKRSRELAQS
jgi:pyrroline-5-carboxylate reductase